MHRNSRYFVGRPRWSNAWSCYPREFSHVPLLCSGESVPLYVKPPRPKRVRRKMKAIDRLDRFFKEERLSRKWSYIANQSKRLIKREVNWDSIMNKVEFGFGNRKEPWSETISKSVPCVGGKSARNKNIVGGLVDYSINPTHNIIWAKARR